MDDPVVVEIHKSHNAEISAKIIRRSIAGRVKKAIPMHKFIGILRDFALTVESPH
jgi:hypothetical protein